MDEQPSGDSPDPQDDAQPPMPEPSQETPGDNEDASTEDESAPVTDVAPEENTPVDTPDASEGLPTPDEATQVSQDSNWSAEPEQPTEDRGESIAVSRPAQVEEETEDQPPEPAAEQGVEETTIAPEESETGFAEEPIVPDATEEVVETEPPEHMEEPVNVSVTSADTSQTPEPLSEAQADITEDGVPLEDITPEESVASYVPKPVIQPKSKKRWWIALIAFVLVAAAGAGVYFMFFLDSDMTEYRNSTLAFSYPKEWNFTDQDQGGLAFYPGETLERTDAIFLIFSNTSAIDGYNQMTADQKDQVKTRLLDYFVSPEFAEEINGDQGSLEFSNGQEIAQKGADMALNFDASGANSAGLSSSGVLRVLIGPGGENVTLLAIALESDWSANQVLYLDVVSDLQVL